MTVVAWTGASQVAERTMLPGGGRQAPGVAERPGGHFVTQARVTDYAFAQAQSWDELLRTHEQ